MNTFAHAIVFSASLVLAACATTRPAPAVAPAAAPAPAAANVVSVNFDRDRAAILSMAGEFRVDFDFRETVALTPGYSLREPHHSDATEWVNVIEDRGDFIALQHILVIGDEHHVVKHWRQDWQYQPAERLVFRGESRWERIPVTGAERSGAWSQTVYHVDDSPRYGGIGRWTHDGGVVAWTSNPTWRPLPRREYSTRSDYQLLDVTNRHLLTPTGWVHEQDNTKHVLRPDGSVQALAKETGLNTYTRIDDYDFSAGRAYWERTAPFWQEVRAAWDARLTNGAARLALRETVEDDALFERMFALANATSFEPAKTQADVAALMQRFERMP